MKKYVIDSQLFVSFTATLLALFFIQDFSVWIVLILFLTYLNGYLYTKFQHTHFLPKILMLNVISTVLLSVILVTNFPFSIFLKWLVLLLLGLFYNSHFLGNYVRRIPLLKIFYVGFVWALMNSWLFSTAFIWPDFLISFFFISALVLPFDIRDMKADDVITFPKLYGIRFTKILASLLLLLSSVLSFCFLSAEQNASLNAAVAISLTLVWASSPERPDFYYSFWVESCTALPFFFLVLMKYF